MPSSVEPHLPIVILRYFSYNTVVVASGASYLGGAKAASASIRPELPAP